MGNITQIYLFGSLEKWGRDIYDLPIQLHLKAPVSVLDILRRIKIPTGMVQLPMVNHRAISKDSTVQPGDRVSLFPKEYPIFADWKDFRSQFPPGDPYKKR